MKKWITLFLMLVLCLSLCACGGGGDTSSETTEQQSEPAEQQDESGNQEIVFEEPLVVVDNEKVTISVTRFFTEYFNEGTNDEFASSGFEVDVENHMEGYKIDVYPRNVSLSDQRVIEFAVNGNSIVAPGKIATVRFTRLDDKAFDDLNDLYELEGDFDLTVTDDNYWYQDLGGEIPFSIPESMK